MRFAFILCALAVAEPAHAAGIVAVDLSRYELLGSYPLPAVAAAEASAVTYDWDSGTLFVLGDEGDALAQVTTRGALVSEMELESFDDTEGVTYIGDGRFALVEERLQNAYRLTYIAGGSADRSDLPEVSLGPTIGNIGLEGLSYDVASDTFIVVKEKDPQRVFEAVIDFDGETATDMDLFDPGLLGVLDVSDVQVLTTVPSLAGRPDHDHLLIYSQESQVLMEVTRDGQVLGSFSFAGISGSAEGVTIDRDGVIYVVDETPLLYVLVPPCFADLDEDDGVGATDLAAVLDGWGTPAGDVNDDGATDFGDVLDLLAAWGACPSYEP